jgi:serine/threonine protein kinase
VKLNKAGLFQDEPFMTLEYVESRNMRDLIQIKSPLLYENILTMFRQMAAALNHVHTMGFWHLDFKPENLIVREDGLVVLVDFDLAYAHEARARALGALGQTEASLAEWAIAKAVPVVDPEDREIVARGDQRKLQLAGVERLRRGDVAHACIGVLEQALDALHYARNGRDSKVL